LNHRVQVFDDNQMPIFALGCEGSLQEQFLEPSGVFVDPQERLYISERGNHRIQVFQIHHVEPEKKEENAHEAQGWGAVHKAGEEEKVVEPAIKLELIFTLGMAGSLKNQFHFPLHMCTNVFEQLFVADSLNHRIQVYALHHHLPSPPSATFHHHPPPPSIATLRHLPSLLSIILLVLPPFQIFDIQQDWAYIRQLGELFNHIKPINKAKERKTPKHLKPLYVNCPTSMVVVQGCWGDSPHI
jgi:hypothetical protein